MSVLSKAYFHDEEAAFAHLESIVWPNGPKCPHCGGAERIYVLKGVKDKKGRVRPGLKKCGHCRKQFTVRVGTVFESSHVELHKWLQAVYLMTASKKGVSSHQLHRILEVTYKTAWFMAHRIREAMRTGTLGPMGGPGSVVEVDETFIGRKAGVPKQKRGWAHKNVVLGLVDRTTGECRTFHVESTSIADVIPIVRANISAEAEVHTDEASQYRGLGELFAAHAAVNHGREEYARGAVTTNRIEGYFSVFKRGMRGTYQHCAEHHLHRYLAEFDFRFSNRASLGIDDQRRAGAALRGIVGKRLMYGGNRQAQAT
ncbi:IS1595 family transposase [Faunimonas sp. B44]|uniref:IS1595 family transposase n=1 Tax=Faunimonas sp. B44 TaxID=3461493 RepID=UPI0040442A50